MSSYDSQREQVWQSTQWLSKNGYFGSTSGSGGNVSFFDREEDVIFITPSGKPYHEMSNNDICIINTDLKQLSGKLPPSIESSIHVSVYLKRPTVNAVVHTHQPYASVFALINKPIPALFDEVTLALGARIEIIPYALSGSAELVANVTKQLTNGASCYILQNHGALSFGENLSQAVHHAETLEKVCQVYYYALCTGEPINRLPESAIQHWMKIRTRTNHKIFQK